MDLSAVIVNWNSGACLGSLLASLEPLEKELNGIWVVDNASTDASLEGVDSGVQVLALAENRGFAGGSNEGISRAGSRFVLLLNPDVIVAPNTVRGLYREIERRPEAAIVCPSLRDAGGGDQLRFQIRPFPTWRSVLSDALFLDELMERLGLGKAPSNLENTVGEARLAGQQPAAAAWLLRREAWEELGGFDVQFHPAWFEDVDFCRRLADSRWEIFYFPGLFLTHQGGHTLDRLGRAAFLEIFYGNLLRYLKKHHPRSYPFLWLPVRCGVWLRRLLVV